MQGWDLFSGIGGIKCGMELAGIAPVLGVELDPGDRTLSEAFLEIHYLNGWKGTRLQTVQSFIEWGCPGLPIEADLAHISPVCSDYSAAKAGIRKNLDNMGMAIASMDAIAIGRPQNWTLEQVPNYQHGIEFAYIKERAIELGYIIKYQIVNVGIAFGQSRRRLIMTASKHRTWDIPPAMGARSWHDTIAHLIPAMEAIEPTPRQLDAMNLWYDRNPLLWGSPLYVERVTSGTVPKARGMAEAIPTLTKSKFRDGSKHGRSKVSCILDRGEWKNCDIKAYAALCGFPPTFKYPDCPNVVGSGFGYAVPPLYYAHLLRSRPQ